MISSSRERENAATEIPDGSLAYFAPAHEGRRRRRAVPESHELHICPAACARRFAINAIEDGFGDSASFLFLSEDDIVTGAYEPAIVQAVDDLLALLDPRPKAVFLHMKCIDDFLGTDMDDIVAKVGRAHPDVRFAVCRIDPVALGGKTMPGMLLQKQLYCFLEDDGARDAGVNLITQPDPLAPDDELAAFLGECGADPVRYLLACDDFESYRAMARSRLNIVLHVMSLIAAEDMDERFGTPYCACLTSFDPMRVARDYRDIAEALGAPCPDLSGRMALVERDFRRTREAVGDAPVAIDSSVTMEPFGLARVLLDRGFQVRYVFASRVTDGDRDDYAWLGRERPDVRVLSVDDYRQLVDGAAHAGLLAVGFGCARVLRASHVVDVGPDDDFRGFSGISRLLSLMRSSMSREFAWDDLSVPGRR